MRRFIHQTDLVMENQQQAFAKWRRQLTFAREYRGFSQTELAKRVAGLSQSNLSKFEKLGGSLSETVLRRMMDALEFPFEFLNIEINNNPESKHYRKKSRIGVKDKAMIDKFVSVATYVFDNILDEFDAPPFNFHYLNVENGISPEEAARQTRRTCRIGGGAIRNICNLLERNGVFVYFWDCEYEDFDGVSLVSDKGNHIIIVNKNMANDRIRFSLAHELGHLVMHNSMFVVLEARDKEKEADQFAAEFLMPEREVGNALLNVRLSALPLLKQMWLTSMSSLIVRAKTLGKIDSNRYGMLMRELSRKGWRTNEPIQVELDSPTYLADAENLLQDEFNLDYTEQAKMMALPTDILRVIFQEKTAPKILKPLFLATR